MSSSRNSAPDSSTAPTSSQDSDSSDTESTSGPILLRRSDQVLRPTTPSQDSESKDAVIISGGNIYLHGVQVSSKSFSGSVDRSKKRSELISAAAPFKEDQNTKKQHLYAIAASKTLATASEDQIDDLRAQAFLLLADTTFNKYQKTTTIKDASKHRQLQTILLCYYEAIKLASNKISNIKEEKITDKKIKNTVKLIKQHQQAFTSLAIEDIKKIGQSNNPDTELLIKIAEKYNQETLANAVEWSKSTEEKADSPRARMQAQCQQLMSDAIEANIQISDTQADTNLLLKLIKIKCDSPSAKGILKDRDIAEAEALSRTLYYSAAAEYNKSKKNLTLAHEYYGYAYDVILQAAKTSTQVVYSQNIATHSSYIQNEQSRIVDIKANTTLDLAIYIIEQLKDPNSDIGSKLATLTSQVECENPITLLNQVFPPKVLNKPQLTEQRWNQTKQALSDVIQSISTDSRCKSLDYRAQLNQLADSFFGNPSAISPNDPFYAAAISVFRVLKPEEEYATSLKTKACTLMNVQGGALPLDAYKIPRLMIADHLRKGEFGFSKDESQADLWTALANYPAIPVHYKTLADYLRNPYNEELKAGDYPDFEQTDWPTAQALYYWIDTKESRKDHDVNGANLLTKTYEKSDLDEYLPIWDALAQIQTTVLPADIYQLAFTPEDDNDKVRVAKTVYIKLTDQKLEYQLLDDTRQLKQRTISYDDLPSVVSEKAKELKKANTAIREQKKSENLDALKSSLPAILAHLAEEGFVSKAYLAKLSLDSRLDELVIYPILLVLYGDKKFRDNGFEYLEKLVDTYGDPSSHYFKIHENRARAVTYIKLRVALSLWKDLDTKHDRTKLADSSFEIHPELTALIIILESILDAKAFKPLSTHLEHHQNHRKQHTEKEKAEAAKLLEEKLSTEITARLAAAQEQERAELTKTFEIEKAELLQKIEQLTATAKSAEAQLAEAKQQLSHLTTQLNTAQSDLAAQKRDTEKQAQPSIPTSAAPSGGSTEEKHQEPDESSVLSQLRNLQNRFAQEVQAGIDISVGDENTSFHFGFSAINLLISDLVMKAGTMTNNEFKWSVDQLNSTFNTAQINYQSSFPESWGLLTEATTIIAKSKTTENIIKAMLDIKKLVAPLLFSLEMSIDGAIREAEEIRKTAAEAKTKCETILAIIIKCGTISQLTIEALNTKIAAFKVKSSDVSAFVNGGLIQFIDSVLATKNDPSQTLKIQYLYGIKALINGENNLAQVQEISSKARNHDIANAVITLGKAAQPQSAAARTPASASSAPPKKK